MNTIRVIYEDKKGDLGLAAIVPLDDSKTASFSINDIIMFTRSILEDRTAICGRFRELSDAMDKWRREQPISKRTPWRNAGSFFYSKTLMDLSGSERTRAV